MVEIGGNITAQIQVKQGNGRNRMGEPILDWNTVQTITGFLDMSSGDSHYTNFNAKIQESTHVFICDYVPLNVTVSESRMLIDGDVYDIKFIDDPMNLHQHLEIFLEQVG